MLPHFREINYYDSMTSDTVVKIFKELSIQLHNQAKLANTRDNQRNIETDQGNEHMYFIYHYEL